MIANLHVAVLRDAASPAGIRQFAAIQSAAPSFGVELIPLTVHDGAEIERGVSSNVCVASMLGAAIVPWDEIVDSPDVLSGELGLIDEAPQLVEQRLGSASSSPTK